jgi:hypothetical protein
MTEQESPSPPPAEEPPPGEAPGMDADPVEFVRTQGQEWLNEAAWLRAVALPSGGNPHTYDNALNTQIRPRLDRLEALRSKAMTLRTTMKVRARVAKDAKEDAWDEAWQQMSRTGGRAGSDYDNARERSARINLRIIAETRAMRQWQIAADMAEDTHEQVKQMHEGMKDVRQDAIQHLKHVVWESTLER